MKRRHVLRSAGATAMLALGVGTASAVDCAEDCAVGDCDDCPRGCYTECGGCLCPVPDG